MNLFRNFFDEVEALARTWGLVRAGQNKDDVVAAQHSQGATASASTEPDGGASGSMTENKSAEQKRLEYAKVLADPELIRTTFFSDMLDDCVEVVEGTDVVNSLGRIEPRTRRAGILPVKVFLTPFRRGEKNVKKSESLKEMEFCSLLEMQFVLLHASLRVGQVILEWNDSNLVIPYHCNYAERVIQVSLESCSSCIESIGQREEEDMEFSGEMERVFVIASKKKKIIDRLIEVVVRYNRYYFYNLIDRNCQHFVMDCLNALEVKLPKELNGGLRDYFKMLAKGRSPSIPKMFKTHAHLDDYVKLQCLESMSQHDLEYVLALYFRFHLESKEKVKNDKKQLEEWVCPEPFCHLDEVEMHVDRTSLLVHNFLKLEAAEKVNFYDSEQPPVQTGAEASGPINVEHSGPGQKRDVAVEAQDQGAAAAIGSVTDPGCVQISKRQSFHMARCLTDPELLWSNYFSGMLDNCVDAVEHNLDEGKLEFRSSLEEEHGKKRMEHRVSSACALPIKLILTPLHRGGRAVKTFASLLAMQFGPLHTSLRVGQVILEWNDSNLVTPYHCDHAERLVQVSLESYSKWTESVRQQHSDFKRTIEELDFSGEVEQIFVIASKKKEMIDRLIEVVVRYNRYYFYNLIDRNCQHFVMDCLDALEVKFPKELNGGLRNYFKMLAKGRSPSIPKMFKTHAHLDDYVKEQSLESMSQHDLEYLLALYFRFHLESKEKVKNDRKQYEEWVCPERFCHMDEVEMHVDQSTLLIHRFRSM